MKYLALIAVLLLYACSTDVEGPKPNVLSVMPNIICTAQGANTLTITGDNFLPIVVDGLTDNPKVVVPRVFLVTAGAQTEVPAAGISLPDKTGNVLTADIPQGLVGPTDPGMAPVVYDIRVTNPDGQSGTLSGGLTVVPPPSLTAVNPNTGGQGEIVNVTLTGTGLRDGMTVTLDATPVVTGTNLIVDPSGASATVDFDLTNVALGTYSISVLNADGCSATLPNAFTVFNPNLFVLTGIDPPFGCTCSPTSVTITSDGRFVSTPTVEMKLSGDPNATPIAFQHVAFVDASTLTAIVPAGAPLGVYDVTVYNPPSDGGIGTLEAGFRVVANPIPSIVAIVPGRGTTTSDTPVTIYGENFRDPVKVELLDSAGNVVFDSGSITPTSSTQIDLTIPTTSITADIYLVRVTDLDENTYFTFSSFLVTNPAGKLNLFSGTSSMTTGRRMLAGAFGDDDLGNHYVYAIGGDTGGGSPTVLNTVEVGQLSRFGNLGVWRAIPNTMTTPRVGASAVAVPVFDPGGSPFIPVKAYLYVLGGRDAGGTVLSSVERAVILSASDAPTITDVSVSTGGTLDVGTWYYKVSAVLAGSDPDNPSGETLPSDEEIVTLSSAGAVTLTWSPVSVNGTAAVAYRIYRTDAVNGASQTEHRIAEVTTTSYTDTGAAAGTEPFLPQGSVGVWQLVSGVTISPRFGHQAAVAHDASNPEQEFVAVLGGKSSDTAYLDTLEGSSITTSSGAIGAFSSGGWGTLTVPRAFFGLGLQTKDTVSTTPFDTTRIWAMGGQTTGGSPVDSLEYTDVSNGGGSSAFTNLGITKKVQSAAGLMSMIINDSLYALGGAQMSTNTSFSNVMQGGRLATFDGSGNLGTISSTASALVGPRALGAVVRGAGFIYFYGGTSDGTNALSTVEKTY